MSEIKNHTNQIINNKLSEVSKVKALEIYKNDQIIIINFKELCNDYSKTK